MATADELQLIENWLYATLSGDATLTALLGTYTDPSGASAGPCIFSGRAPLNADFPMIVFRYVSQYGEGDSYYSGANRLWTRAQYEVLAADKRADYETTLPPIVARIDALLSIGNVVAVTGGNINDCRRLYPTRQPPYEAGEEYRQSGALWAITAQAT